ncbi:MAG: hypothetical protein ABIW46_06550 [Acidimicrobiales bacterium]
MSRTEPSGGAEPSGGTEPIDHPALLAEIDEEVARRRASGELPADFERELDLVFARFAPVHAIGDDFAQVLERAENSTFIDVLAPTGSSLPMVPHVKRVVRKAVLWELRYVAQQVSAFANASVRALRLLGARVDELEGAAAHQSSPGAPVEPTPDREHWAPVIAAVLAGVTGRVLHSEADDGWLVAHLATAGVDTYGVDPVARTAPAGVELREDGALDHLRALPDGALGAVVLSGCVDRLGLGRQRELAALARTKVAAGGIIVILGTDPRSAATGAVDPVAADLAAGRPLHPATWVHLLGAGGRAEVLAGPRPAGMRPVPGSPPDMAANLSRLDEVLFPPRTYALVARQTPAS